MPIRRRGQSPSEGQTRLRRGGTTIVGENQEDDGVALDDHDLAAFLHFAIQAQLGLAGDERAGCSAAFAAAGWTVRLTEIVTHSVATGYLDPRSSTLSMIRDGLQRLDTVATSKGFAETVTLAFGGIPEIHGRASRFADLCCDGGAHEALTDKADQPGSRSEAFPTIAPK